MLNELMTLKHALDAASVSYEGQHPDIKKLTWNPAWRVSLSELGVIDSVERLDGDVVGKLWTLRDGNKNSFPFCKVPELLDKQDIETLERGLPEWKTLSVGNRVSRLKNYVAQAGASIGMRAWPDAGLVESNRRRTGRLENKNGCQSISLLFHRFASLEQDRDAFTRSLASAVFEEADASGDAGLIEDARAIFVSGGYLYFDVPCVGNLRSVGSHAVRCAVSQALSDDGALSMGNCILTGETVSLVTGNFPAPNLPLLGPSYLFSRNRDIPAAARYGKFAYESMPVGAAFISELSGVIEALTVADRRGKTWQIIPSEKPEQNDLMIGFVRGAPNIPVVSLFASHSASQTAESATENTGGDAQEDSAISVGSVKTPQDFESVAGQILEAFDGQSNPELLKAPIDFIILRKVDPANRKAIFRQVLTVETLATGVRRWQNSCRNLPPHLTVRVKGKRGQAPFAILHPRALKPLDLVAIAQIGYIRGGRVTVRKAGITAPDAIALMTERGKQDAERSLDLIVSRSTPLLQNLTHSRLRTNDEFRDFDSWAALRTVAGIGILLHILDHTKERYMTDLGYKMGQMLNAIDVVHRGYCIDIRGGAIPPILLGNSIFGVAQADPIAALSLLCRRWRPYESWVNTPHRPESRYAIAISKPLKSRTEQDWALIKAYSCGRRIGKIAPEIQTLTKSFSTATTQYKAEILLGYMAGLEPAEHTNDEVSEGNRIKLGGKADDV